MFASSTRPTVDPSTEEGVVEGGDSDESVDSGDVERSDDDHDVEPSSKTTPPAQSKVERFDGSKSRQRRGRPTPDHLRAIAKAVQRRGESSCKLITTLENGHLHVAVLDFMGDGETSRDGTGHKHTFVRFAMVDGDHAHDLTAIEAARE